MKNRFIYPCLLALAVASGCIKEEGQPYTITREVRDEAKNDSIPLTVITAENGFMSGMAPKDTVVENSFKTILSVSKNLENLDCYVTMHSEYRQLDLDRNAVKQAGFVYSYTNRKPLLTDPECKWFSKNDVDYKDKDSTSENISFNGTGHNLDFNKKLFIRSYVVTCQGDTIYNPRVVETQTVLPEDVWFQRSDASNVTGRTECFSVTVDDQIYIYGGRSGQQCFDDLWVYDKKSDSWKQKGTFNADGSYYSGKAKRCNGAAFAYRKGDDILLYFAGGQLGRDLTPTGTVFFYSTKYNRFANKQDHPNYGKMYDLYNPDGSIMYETVKDSEGHVVYDDKGKPVLKEPLTIMRGDCSRAQVEDLPIEVTSTGDKRGIYGCVGFCLPDDVSDNGYRYFIAYGKTNVTNVHPVETTIYEYDVYYDKSSNNKTELSVLTWKVHSAGNDRTAQGFYQPVCVECGDRVVIGSGESSRNNNQPCKAFYTLSYDDQEVKLNQLPAPPAEFASRANAAGFYLNYVKDGQSYDRFFVGTGRKVAEEDFKNGDYTQLLNDLWCYDFTRGEWFKRANCSNIHRQGACGFTVLRNDDYYFNTFGEMQRGYFSFGEGGYEYYDEKLGQNETEYKYGLQDNWEYLP